MRSGKTRHVDSDSDNVLTKPTVVSHFPQYEKEEFHMEYALRIHDLSLPATHQI